MTLQKHAFLPRVGHTNPGEQEPVFVGKMPSISPRGHLPSGFSFPGPVHLFPPGEEGGGRAATTTRHDTTRWRFPEAPCIHHAQGDWLIRSGNYPLSLTNLCF